MSIILDLLYDPLEIWMLNGGTLIFITLVQEGVETSYALAQKGAKVVY